MSFHREPDAVANPGNPGFAHFGVLEIGRSGFEPEPPLAAALTQIGRKTFLQESFTSGQPIRTRHRLVRAAGSGLEITFLQESFWFGTAISGGIAMSATQ